MLKDDAIHILFNSPFLDKSYEEGDDEHAPAALPDSSLEFIVGLCKRCQIKRVFEFGSGRSTKALLQLGCSVTSLEDTTYWMNQTLNTLTENEKVNHTPIVKPLTTRLVGFLPVKDWSIDEQLIRYLNEAELILIDSPYYTPFRESTLWSGLTHSQRAIIILDDTRIPTLSKFCDRIAQANSSLLHKRVKVGHTIDLFYHDNKANLHLNQSIIDSLKGWRRYFLGVRLYNRLQKMPI